MNAGRPFGWPNLNPDTAEGADLDAIASLVPVERFQPWPRNHLEVLADGIMVYSESLLKFVLGTEQDDGVILRLHTMTPPYRDRITDVPIFAHRPDLQTILDRLVPVHMPVTFSWHGWCFEHEDCLASYQLARACWVNSHPEAARAQQGDPDYR